MAPRILTPSQLAEAKRRRAVPVRSSHARTDEAFVARYAYTHRWATMTAEQRCTALGIIAADLRTLAEQVDEERLQIAQEELSA